MAPVVAHALGMPLSSNDPNLNRTHISPEESLAWTKANYRTDAVSAQQEFDANGNATNRNIVTFKDGSRQPLHSAYALANPGAGGWQSQLPTGTNAALGIPPALAAAASAPVAQNISQQISNNAGIQAPPVGLPAALAAGTLTPSQITAAGGPLWVGGPHAPQAPLPQAPVGLPAGPINPALFRGPAPSAPVAPIIITPR